MSLIYFYGGAYTKIIELTHNTLLPQISFLPSLYHYRSLDILPNHLIPVNHRYPSVTPNTKIYIKKIFLDKYVSVYSEKISRFTVPCLTLELLSHKMPFLKGI
uniref:Uncharacterized protein n=1 Tax=Meloidogyne enterolobii TaxID=390850 RepID=A0A6V7WPM5_MELEN|nr:unnamed protein product [Meloidogyne enterolobii]